MYCETVNFMSSLSFYQVVLYMVDLQSMATMRELMGGAQRWIRSLAYQIWYLENRIGIMIN